MLARHDLFRRSEWMAHLGGIGLLRSPSKHWCGVEDSGRNQLRNLAIAAGAEQKEACLPGTPGLIVARCCMDVSSLMPRSSHCASQFSNHAPFAAASQSAPFSSLSHFAAPAQSSEVSAASTVIISTEQRKDPLAPKGALTAYSIFRSQQQHSREATDDTLLARQHASERQCTLPRSRSLRLAPFLCRC